MENNMFDLKMHHEMTEIKSPFDKWQILFSWWSTNCHMFIYIERGAGTTGRQLSNGYLTSFLAGKVR